ncbi:MAG: D-alanyl-D-alanine carboxypeptidase [Lachnospiraceae bacterium]|nr:D-alanyl-D-alanine carboxypeptidase [Lachnospiraceae bacterium]
MRIDKRNTIGSGRRSNRAETYGSSRYEDKNRKTRESRRSGSAGYGSGRNSASVNRRRRRRRRSGQKTMLLFCVVFAVLVCIVFIGVRILGGSGSGDSASDSGTGLFSRLNLTGNEADAAPDVSVDLDSLYSPYAVLIDKNTGAILGAKSNDELIYPASMTKILSVWIAIENIKNLDDSVTMDTEFYDALYAEGASQAGFEPGETTVIRELLYGALLPSGAECCMQLAIEAAGSEEALVELMNQKVEALGLTQSHFTNCTGLHDDDQYTTVYEMALILQAALENSTFRTVFTTHYHVMSATDVHPDGFTVWSTFFKNVADEIVTGGEIIGAKTGYTEEAGLCLATLAEVGGREYILVTAGWSSEDVGSYHIKDAFSGYDLLGEALGYTEEETLEGTDE